MLINLKQPPSEHETFNFLGADPAFGEVLKNVVHSLFKAPMMIRIMGANMGGLIP